MVMGGDKRWWVLEGCDVGTRMWMVVGHGGAKDSKKIEPNNETTSVGNSVPADIFGDPKD